MDNTMRDDLSKVLLTEEQIVAKVKEIGAQITKDYVSKKLLLVSVLKGSVVFMADLMRSIDMPLSIDFMCVSSYGKSVTTSGVIKVKKDVDVDIVGWDVLLVEDILDSGLTLSHIKTMLSSRGARSIKVCTLLDKPERRTADIKADYSCFRIPDEFVVGYGLDYDEKYRNLPYIGVVKEEIYSK